MKPVVCVLSVVLLVVVSNGKPIENRSDLSPCVDCNKNEEAIGRVKRTPDGTIMFHEKMEESHYQKYERSMMMSGDNPQLNQFFVGFGNNNANILQFGH